ncbi:hypothetical protein D9M71_749470 [compost metagenome]
MIALHCVKPRSRQPFQSRFAAGTAVYQIANAEQPIHFRVETDRLQALLQAREMPMDIAHGQIAPFAVGGYVPKPAHYNVPLRVETEQA